MYYHIELTFFLIIYVFASFYKRTVPDDNITALFTELSETSHQALSQHPSPLRRYPSTLYPPPSPLSLHPHPLTDSPNQRDLCGGTSEGQAPDGVPMERGCRPLVSVQWGERGTDRTCSSWLVDDTKVCGEAKVLLLQLQVVLGLLGTSGHGMWIRSAYTPAEQHFHGSMKNGTLKLVSYQIMSPGKEGYIRVEYLQFYTACFEYISTNVVYLRRCLVATWLVPPKPAAVSRHALCTLYHHAPVYSFIGRHIRRVHRVHACLAVTCTCTFGRMTLSFYVLMR